MRLSLLNGCAFSARLERVFDLRGDLARVGGGAAGFGLGFHRESGGRLGRDFHGLILPQWGG